MFRGKPALTIGFLIASLYSFAQDDPFPFGRITLAELDLRTYDRDTSASAVVLKELGEAYISNNDDNNLIFEHHLKIKILKRAGFEKANFSIPLYKSDGREEKWISVKASTFNLNGSRPVESKLDPKNVFKETRSEYVDLMKFTLPDIREGSVIEVKYAVESPFIWNFKEWEFQDDIPKISSEFWAKIPGNYNYNMSLVGFLKLSKNESSLIKECFMPGGGMKADCAFYKFGMENVPAFKEEEYMTAKSNFLSAINFELIEVKTFDGRIFKYTREWKDVEQELRTHPDFGAQIRKAKNLFDDKLPEITAGENDEEARARRIYRFVTNWFSWNGNYSKYAEFGIRKSYESRKGNAGDINLALIAIFQEAGLEADPVLLSTRENGLPNTLHPVLSDFNYVVARIKIGDKIFLADATEPWLPFGFLPERCLNGRGRLITKDNADWADLAAHGKQKKVMSLNLKLDSTGLFTGDLEIKSFDYEAAERRQKIFSFAERKQYAADQERKWNNVKITKFETTDLEDIEKPLTEKYDVEIKAFDDLNASTLFIDPFFTGKFDGNPFKSDERLYPVDFGAPLESVLLVFIEFPNEFEVDELPANTAFVLPQGGGRYIFSSTTLGGRITLTSNLSINKSVYSSQEYHLLKEFFNRVIQTQQSVITLKRK